MVKFHWIKTSLRIFFFEQRNCDDYSSTRNFKEWTKIQNNLVWNSKNVETINAQILFEYLLVIFFY